MCTLGRLMEIWLAHGTLQQYFIRAIALKEAISCITINETKSPIQAIIEVLTSQCSDKAAVGYYNMLHTLSKTLTRDDSEKLNTNHILDHSTIIQLHHNITNNKENNDDWDEAQSVLEHNIFSHYRNQSIKVESFIPPHPSYITVLMENLLRHINSRSSHIPVLINAILAHAQFEMIYPFTTENTRTGFMILLLVLVQNGLIPATLLPMNYHMAKTKELYYSKLDGVIKNSDFTNWIKFCIDAIDCMAQDALNIMHGIIDLDHKVSTLITNDKRFFKVRSIASNIAKTFFLEPISGITELSKKIDKSYNATCNALNIFVNLNLVNAINNNQRNKMYLLSEYLNNLNIA